MRFRGKNSFLGFFTGSYESLLFAGRDPGNGDPHISRGPTRPAMCE